MANLFPTASYLDTSTTARQLAIPHDCAIDWATGCPKLRDGRPMEVTGVDAILVWVYHAIKTPRYCWGIFPHSYGCELNALIGRGFSVDATASEITRVITEALEMSDYITSVNVADLTLVEDTVSATVTIQTIYGTGGTVYV